jgi:4-diphosphocytidyl-2-C-methyl-D-erythritol kinase
VKLTLGCAAKINLYLDVLRKRPDGYHDIETIIQPVSLLDEITLETGGRGIELTGDDPAVPWNKENLCYRAARLFLERTGSREGLRIEVHKRIPAGAGLGGGSSDAAGVLIGSNELTGSPCSREELAEIALRLGSDVPFFIYGGPAVARGRGELLEAVDGLPGGWIILAKPDITVSTSWAYRHIRLRLTRNEHTVKLTHLLEGLRRFPAVKLETINSFENCVVAGFPEIGEVLADLRQEDPVMCSLSGSGSTCFALFSEENRAEEVSERLSGKGVFATIARPINQAIELLSSE